jgi:hypothetical protein
MKFTPKSNEQIEKEAAERGPFRPGIYDFEFTDAVDDVSKAGNDMIVVTLKVYNEQGDSKKVKDYIVEAMSHKLKHACETCGLGPQYERGEVESFDFLNRSGKVKLGVKDNFNNVVDYVVQDNPPTNRPVAKKSSPSEDSDVIPF